jgi:hypothetical protein
MGAQSGNEKADESLNKLKTDEFLELHRSTKDYIN